MTIQNHTYRSGSHKPAVDHYADPMDITDVYADEIDVDADIQAAAYFDHNWDGDQFNPTLAGLSITEGGDTVYYGPGGAMDWLGLETAVRLERVYSEELNQ